MNKGDYKYAKFVCPTSGKRFKSKINPQEDIIEEVIKIDPMFGGGTELVKFECHTHCPRCEEYIPWRDRK